MNSTVKRTISGVVFLIIMVGGLLLHPIAFAVLFFLMTAGMLHEFFSMNMGDQYKGLRRMAISVGLLWFASAFLSFYFGLDGKLMLCIDALLLLAFMMVSVLDKDHEHFKLTSFLYAGLLYIAIPLSLANFVVFQGGEFDGRLMLSFFCIIWASDVGAYCFGMLLGQKKWSHKLCPRISPKKSWAGFWGGMLLAILAGAILSWTGLVDFPIWHALIMAAIMHVAGVFGDLFESLWKRACDIKDSGNIIPGHGGLMDRFDSALFAIPAGVIYLIINGLMK